MTQNCDFKNKHCCNPIIVPFNNPTVALNYFKNVDQIVHATSTAPVTFEQKLFDTKINSFSGSIFKPNVAGYYDITAATEYIARDNIGTVQLFIKNKDNIKVVESYQSFSSIEGIENTVSVTTLQFMNGTTDFLRVF